MILCADTHLRSTRPRARIDDYFAAQERKFRFILEQAQASPPLLIAGDLLNAARPGEGLLRWLIDLLHEYEVVPVVVPGQHDLPGHSLDQIKNSGLGVLAAAGVIWLASDPTQIWWVGSEFFMNWCDRTAVVGVPYGMDPPQIDWCGATIPKILLWHHMVINEPLWPGQEADNVHSILKKYPQFDLIVTGDNHQTIICIPGQNSTVGRRFVHHQNSILVNPGSTMRMTASQVEHQPCVFRYQPETGHLSQLFLPIEPDVFDLSELEAAKDKDSRVTAFVEGLDSRWEAGLSFEKGLEEFFKANDTDPEVQKLIWRCLDA
jgi:hypothetical protein